jgi:hypothetical protein
MSLELRNLRQLTQPTRQGVEQLVDQCTVVFGPSLLSVTLFGSVAQGAPADARHWLRSVLVVDNIDLEALRVLAARGPAFEKLGVAAPLFMTPAYVRASLDSFPLELMEIQLDHINLLGDDYFAGLAFENAHVKLQCERELKAVQIGMHQAILATGGKQSAVTPLVRHVIGTLQRTLHGLLWLQGNRTWLPERRLITEAEKLAGRLLPGIDRALTSSPNHDWQQFCQLYVDVGVLREVVDA